MLIPCRGGPSAWRRARFPPPVELELDDGVYVLVDDQSLDTWMYEFVEIDG
jgi:hypothetical protein